MNQNYSKFKFIYWLVLLALVLFSTHVYSHGGRTNSEGCHNNRKTGEYHCHNSKPKVTPRSQSTSRALFSSGSAKSSNFKCKGKTVCKQMKSCAEAKFYLKTCKLYRLDRDNDGIPCESICG